MSNKIKINLKQYYPELYNNDYFIEVDQEIVNVFIEFQRAEWNYNQKIKYHKSYYSLNSQPYLAREDHVSITAVHLSIQLGLKKLKEVLNKDDYSLIDE